MLIVLGFLIVALSVFGGFSLSGGHLGPLYQPMEILIIVGAALGSFIAGNNGKAIKATLRTLSRMRRTGKYDKDTYMDLMALQYKLLTKMRRDGVIGIENDIENPRDSALFAEHPRILNDPLIMGFITDYLRLMVSGSMDPLELDELMMHEIEAFEHEARIPADALFKVGDGLPAFGIIAAVLGVVNALGAADSGVAQIGVMVAHALVGTFMGILLAYGFVNPTASRIERQTRELVKMLQCIRVTLLASLNGYAPQLAVEFGRKTLDTAERPTFDELEGYVRSGLVSA
ncbi:flagellar motor stator protein MotA [Microbulbifer thermotolerans]|uniref:Flagellar motor stator protein MotA n=1 Tax=Microbulbifer thermotolerans TaxID=252514 RepID=A0A143HS35_MICTH|nr:flagellar motor stator protein MotA [Microbulbifer thermotolerans]AMX04220.1 flagellar motor stator protein MotA [Microbulbifer thermotolerans]MCX2783510.1 flagellar motor stator protein MotA [Microbulbifer thermotolerans]MCX2795904.1 flagellar motor stator protein MotA [Microbulbifer thermotolerans]MCX2835562.1 flagellar motor stator protein MotA [Microbulbifer thermotolerans]WKT59774.1 flagellar motor stator protein MotA [Microbulbifer thermotolerans]